MAYFALQAAYAPAGWAALLKEPQHRLEALRPVIERLGGSIVNGWLSFGEYDALVICQLPDNVSAAALSVAISAGGAVKALKMMPLITFEEGLQALRKAKSQSMSRRAAKSPISASIERRPKRPQLRRAHTTLSCKENLMATPLDDTALDVIFRQARTQNKWLDTPVSNDQLMALYDLMRWGPTSANSFPVRIVFVASPAAKQRLVPLVLEGNREKVLNAPVTAILGFDTKFHDWLPRLFPHVDARAWFVDKPDFAAMTAFATAACRGAISSLPRGRSGLIAGQCQASTTKRSIANSSQAVRSSRISSARSGMATWPGYSHGRHGPTSMRYARSFRAGFRPDRLAKEFPNRRKSD